MKARYLVLAVLANLTLSAGASANDESASPTVTDESLDVSYSSTDTATDAAVPAAERYVAAAVKADSGDVIEDVVAVSRSSVPREICVREVRLGSRIPRHICYTQAELYAERLEARRRWNAFANGTATFSY